jgi:hypothetical protein
LQTGASDLSWRVLLTAKGFDSTAVVGCILAFPTLAAWRQTIIVVIKGHTPTAVTAAVTSFTGFFANVVGHLFPPLTIY